jgi:hypothetical protein
MQDLAQFGPAQLCNTNLLPKSPDAAHPKEFQPISLVHFFAKLFAKILAIRLSLRMHDLVNPC